jgi:hypothetical protein
MKAFLASLALAFLFATGTAWAGEGPAHTDGSGCGHTTKWEDT